MADTKLDINRFTEETYGKIDFSEHQLSITPRKDRSELEAEIQSKKEEAAHARRKEMALLYTTLAALFAVMLICAWTAIAKGLASEEGKLAFGALVTIVGTLLGYFTGKNAK